MLKVFVLLGLLRGLVACAQLSEDPFNLEWSPEAAIVPHAVSDCSFSSNDETSVAQCISALAPEQLVVNLHAAPSGPTLSSVRVADPSGVPVEIICQREDWWKVRLDSGETGWVRSDLVPILFLR